MNGTIKYLRETYGTSVPDEILRRTAHDVYREIRRDIMAGNPEQLVEHWTYFLDHEGGDFTLERNGAEIRLSVHLCPAAAYLQERGIPIDPAFRRQTSVLNEALCKNSPFEVITEVISESSYVQTIRKRQP